MPAPGHWFSYRLSSGSNHAASLEDSLALMETTSNFHTSGLEDGGGEREAPGRGCWQNKAGVNNEFSADPDINELAKLMSMPSISL